MNADGTGQTVIGEANTSFAPSWSPDGGRIAFATIGEIFTMDAAGGDVRRLTDDADADGYPAWSPDGNLIAFVSNRGPSELGSGIYTISPASGQITRVLDGVDDVLLTPAWSPDGNMLAYRSEFPMLNDLHITTLDGSPLPYFAPYLVEDGNNPAWSPGGSWIAYRETFRDGIRLIHPDRSDTLFLTVGDFPDWAPAVLVQSPEAGVSGCEAAP